MIAIDTNLLVYAHRSTVPEHEAAQRAIERAARDRRGWGIALPSVAEFWSVVTHPASSGRPSTAEEASGFFEALITDAGAKLWMPAAGHWSRLVRLASELEVAGPRVFDLQIGLTAFDNGAVEVWSHDDAFVTAPGLRLHDPL